MELVENATIGLDREIHWSEHASRREYAYPYHLRIGDAWPELLGKLHALEADHFVLVTDATFPVYLAEEAWMWLSSLGHCTLLTFQGGEHAKNLVTIHRLGNDAIRAGATRRSCIIALGGGLVGNVAGLLAALFFRGARLVHIPTTLLAMSDSCLSLKQGVNSDAGKNHFGQFYAPEFVWADLSYLRDLPTIEIQSALCELIKNVLAICPEHYDELASTLRQDGIYPEAQVQRFITLCIEAKCLVMGQDALEKQDAVILEYGHTVGHALELRSGGTIPHGLAIGMGMVVAARISRMLGMLSRQEEEAHLTLLRRNGAPTRVPRHVSAQELLELMAHDNKRGYLPPVRGKYDMVLLERLGVPHRTGGTVLTHVEESTVHAAIEALQEGNVSNRERTQAL
jgi:3-dehydroquinate synthetase